MKRSTRADIARQTVDIVERGSFVLADGSIVNLAPQIETCLKSTRYFTPEELERLNAETRARPMDDAATVVEVRNETTLAGIARLLDEDSEPVAALNFASAKNPGGGFLNGSQAQEESLARSSALYASLLHATEYYDRHRTSPSYLYSDAMILSPHCTVFRNDDGEFLQRPFLASFITSAAPNAGAAATNRPEELAQIPAVFQRRSEYVLALAASQGYRRLVLGAWGCGVFRNDPALVADVFASHLRSAAWAGRFRHVVFSVLDMSEGQETYLAFQRAFATQ